MFNPLSLVTFLLFLGGVRMQGNVIPHQEIFQFPLKIGEINRIDIPVLSEGFITVETGGLPTNCSSATFCSSWAIPAQQPDLHTQYRWECDPQFVTLNDGEPQNNDIRMGANYFTLIDYNCGEVTGESTVNLTISYNECPEGWAGTNCSSTATVYEYGDNIVVPGSSFPDTYEVFLMFPATKLESSRFASNISFTASNLQFGSFLVNILLGSFRSPVLVNLVGSGATMTQTLFAPNYSNSSAAEMYWVAQVVKGENVTLNAKMGFCQQNFWGGAGSQYNDPEQCNLPVQYFDDVFSEVGVPVELSPQSRFNDDSRLAPSFYYSTERVLNVASTGSLTLSFDNLPNYMRLPPANGASNNNYTVQRYTNVTIDEEVTGYVVTFMANTNYTYYAWTTNSTILCPLGCYNNPHGKCNENTYQCECDDKHTGLECTVETKPEDERELEAWLILVIVLASLIGLCVVGAIVGAIISHKSKNRNYEGL